MNESKRNPHEEPNSCKKDSILSVTLNHNGDEHGEHSRSARDTKTVVEQQQTTSDVHRKLFEDKALRMMEITEETESSSCDETSGSDDDEDVESELQVVIKEHTLRKLAWRWNWLQLQVSDLNHQKMICENKLRSIKKASTSPPQDTVAVKSNSDIDHSEEKRLGQPNGVSADAQTKHHPLFSFKGKKRAKKENEPLSPRKRQYSRWVDLTVQPPTPTVKRGRPPVHRTPTRERLTARLSKRKSQRTNSSLLPPSVKVEEDSDDEVVYDDSEEDSPLEEENDEEEIVIPTTPRTPRTPTTRGATGSTPNRRRTADFNINNIVVPFSSPVVTPKKVENIFIPKWVDVDAQPEATTASTPSPVTVSTPKTEGSSSEDTSDEAYIAGHFRRELEERRRYVSNKKTLLLLSEQFPSDFQISERDVDPNWVRPPEEIITKLQDKFKRIRQRYYDPPSFTRNWRTRKLESWTLSSDSELSSDWENALETLNASRRGRRSTVRQNTPERWEIVHKPPQIDPQTNLVRNLIYLRRCSSTPTTPTQTPPSYNAEGTSPTSPTSMNLSSTTILRVQSQALMFSSSTEKLEVATPISSPTLSTAPMKIHSENSHEVIEDNTSHAV